MPVAITAPGKSGVKIEMYSISRGGGKVIISSVEDCTVLPLARELAHFVGRYQEVAEGAGGGKTLARRKLAGVPSVIGYRVFVVDGIIAFRAGNASARVVRLPTRISLILIRRPESTAAPRLDREHIEVALRAARLPRPVRSIASPGSRDHEKNRCE